MEAPNQKQQRGGNRKASAPDGYYTAAQAIKKLGLTRSMFWQRVKDGTIPKIVLPGHKNAIYLQREIDALASQIAYLFQLQSMNTETKSVLSFSIATPDDTDGIYEIAASLFKSTTSSQDRKALIAACPEGNFLVKEDGKVVAFLTLLPTTPDGDAERTVFAGRSLDHPWGPEDIDRFTPGKTINVLAKSIAATQAYGPLKARQYTQKLLLGARNALADLGKQGVNIARFYCISESLTGIALCLHVGMRSVKKLPNRDQRYVQGRHIFFLDVATSDLPLLQPYKQALAEWRQSCMVSPVENSP